MTDKPIAAEPQILEATRRDSGGVTFWDFEIPAALLARRGRVRRLEKDPEAGIQRNLRVDHAKGMADSMRAGQPFPDNVVVNLVGDIEADGEHILFDPNQITIEIIDGQHRHAAVCTLDVSEDPDDLKTLESYLFACAAVVNASDALRRKLFLQQTRRRPVSRQQQLALQMAARSFGSDTDRDAMQLVETLNVSKRCPLHGKIVFTEATDERGRSSLEPGHLRANTLHIALRPVVSRRNKNSPLRDHDLTGRGEIIIRMLRAADSKLTGFGDPNHFLGGPSGVPALIALLSRRSDFHLLLLRANPGNPYAELAFEKVFTAAKGFNWKSSNMTPYRVAERLAEYLVRRFETPAST